MAKVVEPEPFIQPDLRGLLAGTVKGSFKGWWRQLVAPLVDEHVRARGVVCDVFGQQVGEISRNYDIWRPEPGIAGISPRICRKSPQIVRNNPHP